MRQKVLIVGCGPAGIATAYFLSQRDCDITVIERLSDTQYNRYHTICGGGISRRVFRKLNLPCVGIIDKVECTRIIWPDGTVVKMRTKGYVIDRPEFLRKMKESCRNIRFVNTNLTEIFREDDGYTVNSEHYDWIVGADGSSSTVRKLLFGTKPKRTGSATDFICNKKPPKDFVIKINNDGNGTYTWEFPHGGKCCTGGLKGTYNEDDFIFSGSRNIPTGGVGPIYKDRAFLIGDAAAMANPVSYGGLKSAFLSARKAADAILKNDPESYQKWWNRSILSNERFMKAHETLMSWTPEEMNKAVRPFRHGSVYLAGIYAMITQPKNAQMYVACLMTFKFGW